MGWLTNLWRWLMAILRVVKAAPVLTGVTITPSEAQVDVGGFVQFTAAGVDQYGDAFPVEGGSWGTSNPGVASIDASGRATGLSVGDVDVTLTVDGQVYG